MSTGWRKPFGSPPEQRASRTAAAQYVDDEGHKVPIVEKPESFEEAFLERMGEPIDCEVLSDSLSLSRIEGTRLDALTRTRLTELRWCLEGQRKERAALQRAKLAGRKESLGDLVKLERDAATLCGHRGIRLIGVTRVAMSLLEKHEKTGRKLVEFLRQHSDKDADAPARRTRRVPDEVGDRIVAFLALWVHDHSGNPDWGYVARALEWYGHASFAGKGGSKRAQEAVKRWIGRRAS